MKHLFIPLLATLFLAGCKPPEKAAEPPRTVITVNAGEFSAAKTEFFPAVLRAAQRASLSFQMAGELTDIKVDLGDRFTAGQLLMSLDDTAIQADLALRRAQLQEAKADLAEATGRAPALSPATRYWCSIRDCHQPRYRSLQDVPSAYIPGSCHFASG